MADVYAITFSILGMLLALPALLVALNLLLPRVTTRAAMRLEKSPFSCFFLGVPVVAGILLFIAIVANVPWGPVRGIGFLVGFGGMGLGTLGAAGLARFFGKKLGEIAGSGSQLTQLVRGAAVYELACIFPIVGWFIFAPVVGTMVTGAAVFGLLGWAPKPEVTTTPVLVPAQRAAEQARA